MVGATARASAHASSARDENKTRTNRNRGGFHARTLADLAPDGCRFPVGRATGRLQLFCGRPSQAGPYCAACAPRTRIAGSSMSKDEAAYWAAVAEGRR